MQICNAVRDHSRSDGKLKPEMGNGCTPTGAHLNVCGLSRNHVRYHETDAKVRQACETWSGSSLGSRIEEGRGRGRPLLVLADDWLLCFQLFRWCLCLLIGCPFPKGGFDIGENRVQPHSLKKTGCEHRTVALKFWMHYKLSDIPGQPAYCVCIWGTGGETGTSSFWNDLPWCLLH